MIAQATKKYAGYKNNELGIFCSVNRIQSTYPLHNHDYIEIEYLVSGQLEQEINGTKTVCLPGDCWCLTQYDLHSFKTAEPVIIHNLCVDVMSMPADVSELLRKTEFPLRGSLKEEALGEAVSLFGKLRKATTEDSKFSRQKSTAYLLLLISLIFENSVTLEYDTENKEYKHISAAIEYITQHYTENIRLGDVAKSVFLTPKYLSKLFKDTTGYPFVSYLNHVRINKAKKLLLETDLSVTDIAMKCGFESFPTFFRQFKALCGCSPTAFRGSAHSAR